MNWISVKESLPEHHHGVLVSYVSEMQQNYGLAFYNPYGQWMLDTPVFRPRITHWLEIIPPQEIPK